MQWRNPKDDRPANPNVSIFILNGDGRVELVDHAGDVVWRDYIKGWMFPGDAYEVLKKLKVKKERG